MKSTTSFNINNYKKEYPIIIYGAGAYGEITYYALRELFIKPDYYCDRIARNGFEDVPVIRPDGLTSMPNANILIASADSFYEIKEYLTDNAYENYYDIEDLLEMDIPLEKLSNRARDIYRNKKNYFDVINQNTIDRINFSRIQFVVTEKCSLRCKDCSHLMQYYNRPENVDLKEYRDAFDRFLASIDSISELRILGGEPFMNSEVYLLLEWYMDEDKIQRISIYSNGTILPNKRSLELMKKAKVRLHISDYGCNSEQIKKNSIILRNAGVDYHIRRYDSWQEIGGLEKRGDGIDSMKYRFASCYERNSYSFFRGRLYHCARSAHGTNLGFIPIEDFDCVDFMIQSEEEVYKRKIRGLMSRDYLTACGYCSGPSYHGKEIPAGIQIEHPIGL